MSSDLFVLEKVIWDGPGCYDIERVELIRCFKKKEDAEKAMWKLASEEYPEMVFQPIEIGCIGIVNGDVASSGIRYEIQQIPCISYPGFEPSLVFLDSDGVKIAPLNFSERRLK